MSSPTPKYKAQPQFEQNNINKSEVESYEQTAEVQTVVSPAADFEQLELLRKLEEENRKLEADKKSMQSLSAQGSASRQNSQSLKGHSRQGSVSSVLSGASVSSNLSNIQQDININPDNVPEDSWQVWGDIVNDWEMYQRKKPGLIKDLVKRGIPDHFRGLVWQLICDAIDSTAKSQYAELLKMESSSERLIRRDIARTYPEHEFFREKNGLGQESLFNVMKAYSIVDKEVGYCQGSGFIVGLLLMHMPEEEAYAVFFKIMQDYKLRETFRPNMLHLGLCMFQLDCIVQEQLPKLYLHFQTQGFGPSMFASSWFLTLFTSVLPISLACRIFDIYLVDGLEIIFRVGFAILQLCQEELLVADMEGMLNHFQKVVPSKFEDCPDLLLNTAAQVKYSGRRMKKLEKEYNTLKSKEQEEQVELRRLRQENRILRQRIENLEKETETLAGRLVQQQVNSARREEETFALKRDLSQLKQQHHNVLSKLDSAHAELGELKKSRNTVVAAQDNTEIAKQLQEELSQLQQREVECAATIRELKAKVRELENANQQLESDPNLQLQGLQEELIASKMREAEANLSLKELKHKVSELDKHWQNSKEATAITSPGKQQLSDELMSLRIREAQVVAEMKEMKTKVMDLETKMQISHRHIKRQEEDKTKLEKQLEQSEIREKELYNEIKELERRLANNESKNKEEVILSKIKDTEHGQTVAEMRRRIAELEIENQELITTNQLQDKGENQTLLERVSELEEELLQLRIASKLHSISSLALNHVAFDTESENEDLDALLSKSKDIRHASLSDSIAKLRLDIDSTTEDEGSCDVEKESFSKRKTSRKKRKNHQTKNTSAEKEQTKNVELGKPAMTELQTVENSDSEDGESTKNGV